MSVRRPHRYRTTRLAVTRPPIGFTDIGSVSSISLVEAEVSVVRGLWRVRVNAVDEAGWVWPATSCLWRFDLTVLPAESSGRKHLEDRAALPFLDATRFITRPAHRRRDEHPGRVPGMTPFARGRRRGRKSQGIHYELRTSSIGIPDTEETRPSSTSLRGHRGHIECHWPLAELLAA